MQRLLQVAHAAALLACAFLCVAGGMLAIRGQASLRKINLDLDEAHRVLLEAGLTAMEARKASTTEVAYLSQWNVQLGQSLGNFNALLLSSTRTMAQTGQAEAEVVQATRVTLASTQRVIEGLEPVEQSTNAEVLALNRATIDLDALVTNPHITETIADLKVTADHGAETSKHIDGTTADVQSWVHQMTHPSWAARLWGGFLDLAKVFNPW